MVPTDFKQERGLAMSEQKPLIYGIIHIGSSNLSMRIVQYNNVKDIRVIESVRKDTSFGEEVFIHKNCLSPLSRNCAVCWKD